MAAVSDKDKLLPKAYVGRIMKKALPADAKISMDAMEAVRECVLGFITFVTSEASDKCQREKRKAVNGDDLLWAMSKLGFEDYVGPLKGYLNTAVARDKDAPNMMLLSLPYHLLDEILCRLPVKSLTRFTLVCKAWRDSITDPNFYLQNSKPENIFFLVRPEVCQDFALAEVKGKAFWRFKLVKRPQVCLNHNLEFLGSCVGIVCLGNRSNADPVCILNPITDEYLKLPETKITSSSDTITSGFGVTSTGTTKQYKVVAIRRRFTEVWTVGSNYWRNIGCGVPDTYRFLYNDMGWAFSGALFEGSLHWIVYDTKMKRWLICVFNLETEKYHSISLTTKMPGPWILYTNDLMIQGSLELGMVRGSLVVCDYGRPNGFPLWENLECGNGAEVWEMKEYGKEESWMKKFIVGPSQGFSLNGILCYGYRSIRMVEENQQVSEWLGMFSKYKDPIISIDAYVPTLASPGKMIATTTKSSRVFPIELNEKPLSRKRICEPPQLAAQ